MKKRKIGANKEEKAEKPKKPKKMPTEFKKGKWNPNISLIDTDKYREAGDDQVFLDCCIRCNNKNIIRAAVTGNTVLLMKGINHKDNIASLTAYWSPEVKLTAMDYIVTGNNHDMLELLLHPKLKVPVLSTYEQERATFYRDRVRNPQYLMDVVDTGMVSHMAYGTRVRKVQATRGNRQGNNAFMEYEDNQVGSPVDYSVSEDFLRRVMYTHTVTVETLQQIFKLHPQIEVYLQSYAYEAVRAGNMPMAHYLIQSMQKHPNFGFNQLHVEVLSDQGDLGDKVLRASCTKKANTNKDITPLHCACINPDPKYLKALLDAGPDVNTVDADLRKPVHYAAACASSEPLQLLVKQGVSLVDVDN